MKSIHILLVEDNEGDIMLTTEALEESKIINKVSVIRDGHAAIKYFEQLKDDHHKPDIVLLDINLPKKSGQEVLAYIKQHPLHSRTPVIMLTTSSAERDIHLSYKNHANCYITKPVELHDFINAISKIQDFWINIVSIPNQKQ